MVRIKYSLKKIQHLIQFPSCIHLNQARDTLKIYALNILNLSKVLIYTCISNRTKNIVILSAPSKDEFISSVCIGCVWQNVILNVGQQNVIHIFWL